jgi:hypothetical protein
MVEDPEFFLTPSSAAVEAAKQSRELREEQQEIKTITQYGVFNDEEVWGPLFEAGEMPEALREILVDRPLYQCEILPEAVRHAKLINEERGLRNETEKIGFVLVKTRNVVEHPWKQVPWEEVEQSLFGSG